ncbi:MobF family relaxase [Paracraurococcus lichenis]|uniref:MobF family relaxase n=1 Tax=Paracraurococcus lichenis TaxID=3064888 RepID=A0ABT9E6G7_9PROT|nr:MobF family relaxase [Paracraurococcus sp. LOR1-02]MDO9711771.1 MobF family relaxase [Paracraurococcus sp. LOR1-02]
MVCTYRTFAPGARQEAAAYAAHLLEKTLAADRLAQAVYYTQGQAPPADRADAMGAIPLVRADLDPALARALAITPHAVLAPEALAQLLAGRRADGEEIERASHQNPRVRTYEDAEGATRHRIAGIDLTFSAPKSLSVAWAMAATEAERWSLLQAHRDAVTDALHYVEREIGLAQGGKARSGPEEPARLAWITIEHFTARPTVEITRPDPLTGVVGTELYTVAAGDRVRGDPQLHTHTIVPNLMVAQSGRLAAVNRDLLQGRIHEFGAVYHAMLATHLRRLGVEVVLCERTRTARLPVVPEPVCEAFSHRTRNGTAAARAFAAEQGLDWDSLDADRKVALLKSGTQGHRLPRDVALTPEAQAFGRAARRDDLADFEAWAAQAARIGFRHATAITGPPAEPEADAAERAKSGWWAALPVLERELDARAVVRVADARVAAARGLIASGAAETADVDRVLARLASQGVRQQGRWTEVLAPAGISDPQARLTTGLHHDQEAEVIRLLRAAAADQRFALAPATLRRVTAGMERDTEIGRQQTRAVEVVGAGGAVSVFIGVGGSGKTTRVLARLVSAYRQAEGREVWGIAQAWEQGSRLAEAGIDPMRTFAVKPFLDGLRQGAARPLRLRRGAVVVLDEFSQVGTRELLELLRARQRHGFKLVLTGDERQAQSVEAGPIIKLLAEALGRQTIPEILVIRRQASEREREIATLFRGRREDGPEERLAAVSRAIAMKREDGTAELVPGGREEAIRRTAEAYMEACGRAGPDPGYTVTVSAPTNADAHEISLAIRALRRAAGQVGRDAVVVEAMDGAGRQYAMALAPGDRIRLYRRTHARFVINNQGWERSAIAGNNGTVLTVRRVVDERVRVGRRVEHRAGLEVVTPGGKVGFVAWERLRARGSTRLQIAYGDCRTIDSSQGITSDEHINALPGGSRTVQGFKNYVASSRHRVRSLLLSSAGAELRQVDELRPAGVPPPADWAEREAEAWDNLVANLARQPVKETAHQLLAGAVQDSRHAIRVLQQHVRTVEARERAGLAPTTLRDRLDQADAARHLAHALGEAAQGVRAAARAMPQAPEAVLPQVVSSPPPSPAPPPIVVAPQPQPQPQPVAAGSGGARSPPVRPRRRVEISEIEAQQQFADALRTAGLKLDGLPVMDGQRHYAPVEGNRGRQKSGAYMGFFDSGVPNGIVWNYKAGTRSTWKARGETVPLPAAEARRLAEQATAARAATRAAQQTREDAAAQRTAWLLEGTRPATPANAYLRRKGVTAVPPGLREDLRGNLVIPLRDTAGHLRNMQTILARPPRDGTDKLYQEGAQKSGTGFLIGTLRPGEPLGLAEGFATAWSAHSASGLPVVVALDTSNLLPLAAAIRRAEPERRLVFFADNDHHLPAREPPLPNAGLEKANAAADTLGNALVVAPPLDPARHAAGKGTDWNDYHQTYGLEATRSRIAATLRVGAAQAEAGPDPAQEMPDRPARAQRARPEQVPQGEPPMTDSRIHKARAQVRQEREREVDIWQAREQAGRTARQADAPRQASRPAQGTGGPDDGTRPKAGPRQGQAPSA